MESRFTLRPNVAKSIYCIKKLLQTKNVKNEISCKKLSGHVFLSPPGVAVEAPNICYMHANMNWNCLLGVNGKDVWCFLPSDEVRAGLLYRLTPC